MLVPFKSLSSIAMIRSVSLPLAWAAISARRFRLSSACSGALLSSFPARGAATRCPFASSPPWPARGVTWLACSPLQLAGAWGKVGSSLPGSIRRLDLLSPHRLARPSKTRQRATHHHHTTTHTTTFQLLPFSSFSFLLVLLPGPPGSLDFPLQHKRAPSYNGRLGRSPWPDSFLVWRPWHLVPDEAQYDSPSQTSPIQLFHLLFPSQATRIYPPARAIGTTEEE